MIDDNQTKHLLALLDLFSICAKSTLVNAIEITLISDFNAVMVFLKKKKN
jgi:hypothetical protein